MKHIVRVWLTDDEVAVQSNHGMWEIGDKDDRWLNVLAAIAYPEQHKIEIVDKREQRQAHQTDLSCKRGYE